MKKSISILIAGAAALTASQANAATVIDGSCVSVTDSAGCLFSGNINSNTTGGNSFLNAQNAYNLYNDTHPTADPDILLTVLAASDDTNFSSFGSITGGGSSSGTWDLTGFDVDFVAVKASNAFVLYQLSSPASMGSWDTFDIPFKNNPHNISHLVFFGTETVPAVPEPATWAFMIFGFGAIGGAMRRNRKANVKVSYA
ncbi:PEPxxWA-CTERM sorting domain-containing protein [Parasphingorhabdus sp.]|uniref:PEPxxWA-CTERM sorting domain-containing protein n=1 Tax=Parasphingorhabdus sp. TaxID=2709688 RepID=UPI0032637680